MLEALGQAVVAAGKNVAWFTLEQVGALVRRHRADNFVTKAIARILRANLVVVDDIGLCPWTRRGRGPLPDRRRRLRAPQRRGQLESPPVGI